MRNVLTNRDYFRIVCKDHTFNIPKYIVIVLSTLVATVLLCTFFAFIGIAKSAHEIEKLKQQLIIERTINQSLAKEIQKSNEGIEKIMNTLTKSGRKKTTGFHGSISSPIQLYGILQNIQQNLLKIDQALNGSIEKVRTIINLTKIRDNNTIVNGLSKLNLAESIPVNQQSPKIQKASKITNVLSGINLQPTINKVLIKNDGLNILFDIIKSMPIEKPVKNGRFVSGFGKRFHPIHRYTRMHNGIDFVGPKGAKVLSTADGIIQKAVYSHTFGNYVVIQHKNNIKTLYAHMSKLNVRNGQKVKLGDTIGTQGTTGTSTGEHVHYEIIINNQHHDPLNFIRTKAILQDVQ